MSTIKKSILQKGKGKSRRFAKLEYLYEKESLYFAQTAETIKNIAMEELRELNATDLKPVFRGVWFRADKKNFYKIIYCSRLISRILIPLMIFECKNKNDLYKAARKIRWEEFMTLKNTFSITANVSNSNIIHSNFAGLKIKDAIVDYFRDRSNKRPNVTPENPDISFNIHINEDMATLSVDASGGPLHKRGYREESISAPMQETIAAAIIKMSNWDGSLQLYDPMCGSGTLLCEALMSYCRIPAQVLRENFGFERLPDFDSTVWEQVKSDAWKNIRTIPKDLIKGSDISKYSVDATKTNLMCLHHGINVEINLLDFQKIEQIKNSIIISNPPYGIRMGKEQDMNLFYKQLGLFLKERCKQNTAYIYFGEPRFIKKVPLAPSWKLPLNMGGLNGKLVKYDLF